MNLAKRLSVFEEKYKLSSEDFFDQFQKGLLGDKLDFIEWSNDYQNLLALKFDLEKQLTNNFQGLSIMKTIIEKDGEGFLAKVEGHPNLFAFGYSEKEALVELKNVVEMILDYHLEIQV